MDWKERHPGALAEARRLCRMDSAGHAVITVIVVVVGITALWLAAGPNEAWSEVILKGAGTAVILLIFPVVYLWNLVQADAFVRRQATMLFIAIGIILTVAGTVFLSIGLGRAMSPAQGAAVIPESVTNALAGVPALAKQVENLSKQLEQRTSASPPTPPKPETEVVHGPYQPEEAREMILALGQMQDTLEKRIRPSFMRISALSGEWSERWQKSKDDEFPKHLDALREDFDNSIRELHKVIFQDSARFQSELRPPIEDSKNIINTMSRSLKFWADNARSLIQGGAPKETVYQSILARDAGRIFERSIEFNQWVTNSIENVKAKTARLRAHRA